MDRLLRSSDSILRPDVERLTSALTWLGWLVAAGCGYGAVMGMFGGVAGARIWQVVFSAVKVPMLLGITFALALPSFFVLNTVLGLRDDFPKVLTALLRSLVGTAIVLAALAPYTAVWYLSSENYNEAILFNALMFGIASVTAQWTLRKDYAPLIANNPRHRWMMRGWLFVFAFVGIQMGWVLRPFIGDPNAPTRFFREGAWGNAYEQVGSLIVQVAKDWLR